MTAGSCVAILQSWSLSGCFSPGTGWGMPSRWCLGMSALGLSCIFDGLVAGLRKCEPDFWGKVSHWILEAKLGHMRFPMCNSVSCAKRRQQSWWSGPMPLGLWQACNVCNPHAFVFFRLTLVEFDAVSLNEPLSLFDKVCDIAWIGQCFNIVL